MSITQLQKQIKEGEDKIAPVQQSKASFEQQLGSLRAEEQSLIVSSRTGDEAAKARRSDIRQEIDKIEREIQDDVAAISHITGEVETLRASLVSEQRADERNKILIKLNEFTERSKANRDRISAAATELREIGYTCMSEAKQVHSLLVELSYCPNDGSARRKASSLESVNLSSMSVMQSLSQAADLLEQSASNDYRLDCMHQMQRFIVALGQATRGLEREVETVLA